MVQEEKIRWEDCGSPPRRRSAGQPVQRRARGRLGRRSQGPTRGSSVGRSGRRRERERFQHLDKDEAVATTAAGRETPKTRQRLGGWGASDPMTGATAWHRRHSHRPQARAG